MSYIIRDWTKKQANKLGLQVFPAQNDKNKIEVYDENGVYVASVGALGSGDYAQYLHMEQQGQLDKGYADERRRLYHLRHRMEKGWNEPMTRSWLAKKLLW